MFDVGEDVFHSSRDNTRLVVISRLEKQTVSTATLLHREKPDHTHQRERLSRSSLPVGKHNGIVTLHSGNNMISRDLVVNGFILRSGDEFVEMEFWRSSAGGFRVLGVEFYGLGA